MLETSDLHEVFTPDFLDENPIKPEIFDEMNRESLSPHFNHETLNIYPITAVTTPERVTEPEVNVVSMITRAGKNISFERGLHKRYDVAA